MNRDRKKIVFLLSLPSFTNFLFISKMLAFFVGNDYIPREVKGTALTSFQKK